MSLKSVKSVGKVSKSSIIIISDNEYSCLHSGSHFTCKRFRNTRYKVTFGLLLQSTF
jgi:hypothetical protein